MEKHDEYIDPGNYIGYFKKDAGGKVWYSFEHPDVTDKWLSVDDDPPDTDAFGYDDGPVLLAAWQAIVDSIKSHTGPISGEYATVRTRTYASADRITLKTAVCYFCNTQLRIKEPHEADWIPYFFDKSDIEHGPVCSACAREKLVLAQDGEWTEA